MSDEKLLPGQKWEGHIPLLRDPTRIVASGDAYPDSSRNLTWAAMMEAIDRVDSVVRPWRHLIGRCDFYPPSRWCPDGQLYVLNLDKTSAGIGFSIGSGYRIVGTSDDYATLRTHLNSLGIPEREHAAAVVFFQLEKWEAKRRAKEAEAPK